MPPPFSRYSSRLRWTETSNDLSRQIAALRHARAPLIDLTATNPTTALAAYPSAQIAEAFAQGASTSYEPAALGTVASRQTIAGFLGSGISFERIALTASTSEAYSILFKLLCDPGDEILIPAPSYPLFDYLAYADAVTPIAYRLRYDGRWYLDFESLTQAISNRTKAIVLVNPNNPTGSFLTGTEWDLLIGIAQSHQLAIVCDEVFSSYPLAPSNQAVATLAGRNQILSFSLNGLSKGAGMPHVKLGWITVNGPAPEAEDAVNRLELLLDSYLSVGTPVQNALPRLLAIGADIHRSIEQRTWRNLETLQRTFTNTAAHPLHVEAGWCAVLQLPQISTEEGWLRRFLVEDHVIVQPGYFFDMETGSYVVISLLPSESEFAEGVTRLRNRTEQLAAQAGNGNLLEG